MPAIYVFFVETFVKVKIKFNKKPPHFKREQLLCFILLLPNQKALNISHAVCIAIQMGSIKI
jgi:hypothetical protein